MATLPPLKLNGAKLYTGIRNNKGQLCNIYTPLQNLTDSKSRLLDNFSTELLNFDMEHPVDILLQDSYDGAVNMILNDGKNKPRLINSRFSVQDENTFKIPDHSGFKDTNIYDEDTFDVDTQLKAIPIKIPTVTYNGLIDNGGTLKCGSYSFYFKLSDADGNETEVINDSGIVQVHIGMVNQPSSIRMGQEDENTNKAISFTLSNIDNGFDYVHVLFTRTSSGNDQAAATTYQKVIFDYPTDKNGVCEIVITGNEQIIGLDEDAIYTDYADINSVKTQTVNNGILMFGNVDTPEHDWEAIKRFTWKIIPRWRKADKYSVGSLNSNYQETSLVGSEKDENGFCYYNTKNVYYKLGYWPDEIYRFGIVYVFEDNSLSPVINIQGIDFSLVDIDDASYIYNFFEEQESEYYEHLFEPENLYFNEKYRCNSRGVCKFPKENVFEADNDVIIPTPLYISFDFSHIGYKQLDSDQYTDWKDVFKKHKIKGYFFVRQKRVPTILAQGLVVGLAKKDYGSIPAIKNSSKNYIVQPFLHKDRLLYPEADDFEATSSHFTNQAMLCPDAELNEATFNQLFVATEFTLQEVDCYNFNYNNKTKTASYVKDIDSKSSRQYTCKLLNIPEDTKILTNGVDYYSTLAGNPDEPYKTKDVENIWNKTKPQDLTSSISLIRGKWGPFVGMSNPLSLDQDEISNLQPFDYGQVFNIKLPQYNIDPEGAVKLDFQKAMNSTATYSAISRRTEIKQVEDCFGGDCFISMFTHRMFRNFSDPELPTNHEIIDPSCWSRNYAVRTTAQFISDTHSNLGSDVQGFYINDKGIDAADATIRTAAMVLTGNVVGMVLMWINKGLMDFQDLGEASYPKDTYANEIVEAFEVYTGNGPTISLLNPFASIARAIRRRSDVKKKVNPKQQEKDSKGFSLKKLFKSDDDWELRGLADINRADVNAVSMGQWITFPICSNKNIAMRDIDYSNATEQASFNRKRSFYPLAAKDITNTLRDSNVINQSAGISLPQRKYFQLPKVPYFKQEFFTRINNSLRDSSSSVANEFKVMLQNAYFDYTKVYGSITKLESKGNYTYIIFKHGIGVLDMFSALKGSEGKPENFLPDVAIIDDTHGSIWKDSIISTPLGIYGVDSVAKCIWRIRGDQVEIISDLKVGKFLIDHLDMSEFNFRPYIAHINIKSHYNAFKNDVIFTYYNDKLYEYPLKENGKDHYTYADGKINLDGYLEIKGKDGEITKIKARKRLPAYDKDKQDWQSFQDIINEMESAGGNYQWVNGTIWSLCYNEQLQQFQTFYDWYPVESANIDNIYFSFNKDDVYKQQVEYDKYFMDAIICNKLESGEVVGESISPKFKQNKHFIDNAFNDITFWYRIKSSYFNESGIFPRTSVTDPLYVKVLGNKTSRGKYIFSFYIKVEANDKEVTIAPSTTINIKVGNSSSFDINLQVGEHIPVNEWAFVYITLPIYTGSDIIIEINDTELNKQFDYIIAETKAIPVPDGYSADNISYRIVKKDIDYNIFNEVYELRSASDYMKLWKHGQAGVYDNQGKIKPTNWYGKQHEFNFEFIVNQDQVIQKIFNNLKIISNKAEPYKFEYEVVGEAYEWYEYKKIVYWINDKFKSGEFKTLREGFEQVLTNYSSIVTKYPDFPGLPMHTKKLLKLPYLEIKLKDKQGLPDKDKSYTNNDKWTNYSKIANTDDYKYNSVDTVILEDKQLNEYRLHTEQYANNMKKYGRIRGNMEYLEDLWDVEIRPIYFTWLYVEDGQIKESAPQEARLRDKYIKIRVRYSGEDLAIIQAISTMFNYSYA